MNARVVTGKTKPGKLDDFVKLFQNELLPGAKGDEGFQKLSLFVDRSSDRVLAFAIYDSEASRKASAARFEERAARAGEFLSGPPASEEWEVAAES